MPQKARVDNINHPAHYTKGRFETIDVIEDIIQFYPPVEAHSVAEIIRYLSRAPHKGAKGVDLAKAKWYLDRLVVGA